MTFYVSLKNKTAHVELIFSSQDAPFVQSVMINFLSRGHNGVRSAIASLSSDVRLKV